LRPLAQDAVQSARQEKTCLPRRRRRIVNCYVVPAPSRLAQRAGMQLKNQKASDAEIKTPTSHIVEPNVASKQITKMLTVKLNLGLNPTSNF
jgi:hypothetical protein